jgi:hypothetical protein
MARTRSAIQPLNLYQYDVLIEDKSYRSDYFKLTQFDGYLYGGRNAFLIAGDSVLKPNTNILIEVLDSEGVTVYSAPVANYIEGSSRLIQLEIYQDTPIGVGKIVILACAETYLDGTPIPTEWQDVFNVRWVADVVISPLVENKTPIRFSQTPSMVVEEKFYFTPSSSIFNNQISIPVDVELDAKYYNVYVNGYIAKIKGPGNSTRYYSKYLNGVLSGSFAFYSTNGPETASINIPITRIFNSKLAESEGALIYTDKNIIVSELNISSSNNEYQAVIQPYGRVTGSSTMNLVYNELVTESTGSAISFAKIRLVDLNTLSGEINKVRVSFKVSTDPGQYQLLGDVPTGVAELLTIDSGSRIVETGYFTTLTIPDYWYSATMSVQPTDINPVLPNYYNSSSLVTQQNIIQNCCTFLLDSINATPEIVDSKFKNNVSYFIGTKNNNTVSLFPRSEYTLSFKALVTKQSASLSLNQSDYSMEVYLIEESGSVGRLLETNKLGQFIGRLQPEQAFLNQNFDTVEFNFAPKINAFGKFGLRFVIYGGFWNIADVSVKTTQEPFFSPDEIDILLPNTIYTNNLLTFKAEYLDIDNNSVGENTISLPEYFTGSAQNQQFNIFFDNGII